MGCTYLYNYKFGIIIISSAVFPNAPDLGAAPHDPGNAVRLPSRLLDGASKRAKRPQHKPDKSERR